MECKVYVGLSFSMLKTKPTRAHYEVLLSIELHSFFPQCPFDEVISVFLSLIEESGFLSCPSENGFWLLRFR